MLATGLESTCNVSAKSQLSIAKILIIKGVYYDAIIPIKVEIKRKIKIKLKLNLY